MMRTARCGFTLVEIMIVVAILGLIAALVLLPNVLRSRLTANDSIAQTTLKTISNALEVYLIRNNTYPNDTDLLLSGAPPYLQTDFFDGQTHSGFNYTADTLTDYTYSVMAAPVSSVSGTRSFTISTGGVLAAN